MRSMRAQIFGIDTQMVTARQAIFFVPEYAMHRPVAQRVLDGRLAELDLHRLVKKVYETWPGSMVHAGTFFGDMLPSFSRKVPGRVYAFEPVLENYLMARAVLEVNQLDNVVLLHAGLGSEIGTAAIQVGDLNQHFGGASRFFEGQADPTMRTQTTSIMAVDNLAIEDLVLLQLDVEGFELEVLKGAVKTIAAAQPVIVLEDGQRNCADFLAGLGYAGYGRVAHNFLYLTPERAKALGYPEPDPA